MRQTGAISGAQQWVFVLTETRLCWSFICTGYVFLITAAVYLAYTDPAVYKLSGTDPDQDVKSFVQIIKRKVNFAREDAPTNAKQLADYIFCKKVSFPFHLEVQLPIGMKAMWKLLPKRKISERDLHY